MLSSLLTTRFIAVTVLLLAALAHPAGAMVLYGADGTENTKAPPNGAPWHYVARLDPKITAPASGVYLGNWYVLTADHVTPPVIIGINGTERPPAGPQLLHPDPPALLSYRGGDCCTVIC